VSLHSRIVTKHNGRGFSRKAGDWRRFDWHAQATTHERSSRALRPRTIKAATAARNSTRSPGSTTDAAKQSTNVQNAPGSMLACKALAETNSEFLPIAATKRKRQLSRLRPPQEKLG
jgi:hypothetical protein